MAAYLRDVIAWMVSTIADDTVLQSLGVSGTFMYNAPEGQDYPYIIIQKTAETHKFVFGDEAYNEHWLAVKALDKGFDGGDRARQVMDRVRFLFKEARPTLTSGYTMVIRAQSGFELCEAEAGNNFFYHVGTVFVPWLGE